MKSLARDAKKVLHMSGQTQGYVRELDKRLTNLANAFSQLTKAFNQTALKCEKNSMLFLILKEKGIIDDADIKKAETAVKEAAKELIERQRSQINKRSRSGDSSGGQGGLLRDASSEDDSSSEQDREREARKERIPRVRVSNDSSESTDNSSKTEKEQLSGESKEPRIGSLIGRTGLRTGTNTGPKKPRS